MDILNFLNNSITEEDTYAFTIVDILKMRAEHTPDKTAYIFLKDGENDEEKLTYKELHDAATSIAAGLAGISGNNERAIMFYPPGLEFIKALFGCFYAGIIAVPAYPPRKNRSLDRIKSIVTDSGATIIMSTDQIYHGSVKNFSDFAELEPLKWMITDSETNKYTGFSGLKKIHNEGIALLQYTSGSTGTPKGVMISHKNIVRNTEYIRKSFELGPKSVSVTWLPSFHDMGLIDGVIEPIYTGFTGILISPVDFLQKPSRWLKAITRYKGTHCGGPNFGFDLCTEKITEEEKEAFDLSSMHTLYNGAEPIRKRSLESFTAAFQNNGFKPEAFYPCYGMAETTLIISGVYAKEEPKYLPVSAEALEKNKVIIAKENADDRKYLVGVGHAWIDTDIRIINPHTGNHCKPDEVGEIWVSGSIVAKGYWGNKEETEKTFHAYIKDNGEGPFLRTGDLGFFHEGELYVSGRLKDLIIIRGRNIYPQDVELVTESSHEAIRANCSAAFSVEVDEAEQLVIVAELERTFLRDPDIDDICDSIRQAIFREFELDVYAIELLRTASIPKTSSGKIQRRACRKGFIQGRLKKVARSILENTKSSNAGMDNVSLVSVQSWLMAWISSKLKIGMEKIHPGRPIVAYGLNSLKAVQLRNDFLETFGVDFPPYLFYEKMTFEQAAKKAYELIQENSEAED